MSAIASKRDINKEFNNMLLTKITMSSLILRLSDERINHSKCED